MKKKYEDEVQINANSMALGMKIAMDDESFEGMKTAMSYVRSNAALKYAVLLQRDTVWNDSRKQFSIKDTILASVPENMHSSADMASNDSTIVKQADFRSQFMNGSIFLAFSTREISRNKRHIRLTSLIVSGGIFLVGMLIGLWLARSISIPVLAIRKAARQVGAGDLTSEVKNYSRDEIGDLAKSFNTMVQDVKRLSDLSLAQEKEKQQILASQKEDLEIQVSERTNDLKKSLEDLRSAQAQLIQSEKMASLGQLTAGIAHEIQNPLNFVNNFSEVNKELLSEMQTEIEKGNFENARIIAKNVIENEEKINSHGKRADSIVKGMLQHSRTSSGKKEFTDIKVLCEEYLRLAYHGFRAKDKSFNVTLETNFDEGIGEINIIPQEIGRVLLNIYNNGFYAVGEKKNKRSEGFEPTISVTIKKEDGSVEIRVKDNGIGIPEKLLDKIFQPFFTTKPTGQGTGLGLSQAYDIVKAHGGELTVTSVEGKGSLFIVRLPIR